LIIFIIDSGLDTKYDDFNTYESTKYERIVIWDDFFYFLIKIIRKQKLKEKIVIEDNLHGQGVIAAANGKYVGFSKYVNMLACLLYNVDELNAPDYVKSIDRPHKAIINISRVDGRDTTYTFKDKFEELPEKKYYSCFI